MVGKLKIVTELCHLRIYLFQLWHRLVAQDDEAEGIKSFIAVLAGKIQYQYRFGIGDSIIIATAKRYKCSFIRTDQKEFERVKGIRTRW